MKKYYSYILFIILFSLIFISYPYISLYYTKIPPKLDSYEYLDKIHYNHLEQDIILYKLQHDFNLPWFDVLQKISLRQGDYDITEKNINLSIKHLDVQQNINYILFYGIKNNLSALMSNYLNNLPVNHDNKNKLQLAYCNWGLFLDKTLPNTEAKLESNSIIINNLKHKFQINAQQCPEMIPLIRIP